jgi:Fe-S cluster assembly protein SufD
MTAEVSDTRQNYLASFARLAESLNGKRRSFIHPIREAAIERFAELGFPTTRDEEWRHTNIAPLVRTAFQPATGGSLGDEARSKFADFLRAAGGDRLPTSVVFVNGAFAPELSSRAHLHSGLLLDCLPAALECRPEMLRPHLAQYAGARGHAFTALNTALFRDGAFIHVARGAVVEEPIYLVYLSHAPGDRTVSYPRTLIVAEDSSQITVVESYLGCDGESYFTNPVTEIVAGENAVVDHYRLQWESLAAFHVATVQIQQARSSNVTNLSVSLGGGLSRCDLNATLAGEGAECTLNGLYTGAGEQIVDHHTRIDHAKPHCASHELYKGILDGSCRGVFNGKIYVHPDAQKTDAKQTNQCLLLSEEAQINTKPQLEIFADDVRCTHGATVGQLNAEAVFYLRTRGLPAQEARRILTYAFAREVIDRTKIVPLRGLLERLIVSRLSNRQAAGEEI